MIRPLQNTDIDRVADIWLTANRNAHDFIAASYWTGQYAFVKQMLPQAEVYVYEADRIIQGFVGLREAYIEGIFVADPMQSHGIGKQLLDYIKDRKAELQLNVYLKNKRAIQFYRREGFTIRREGLDESTGEPEYTMLWQRNENG